MSGTLHILLIDDNPDDRLLMIRELSREFDDPRIVQIKDQQAFEEAIEKGGFDLIITDYQLHWTTGLDVLESVKNRFPDMPVIMFTGTGSEEVAVEAMKAGLDDYVLKSIRHIKRLPAAVRAVLEKSKQRLATLELEARYRRLFENFPAGLFRSTPEGRLLDLNPAGRRILGIGEEEPLDEVRIHELCAHPDDQTLFRDFITRDGVVQDLELPLRRYDGKITWVRMNARAVQDSSGNILYCEGSFVDITERKKREEEQKKLEAQLFQAQKMEAIGRLAGGVAHDFNNMLSVIRGYCDLALSRLKPMDPLFHDLTQISEAAARSADLTRQLLAFSRRQTIEPVKLDFNVQLENMERLLKRILGEHIELVFSPSPNLWPVYLDQSQVDQVVANLAVNARDAMPNGGRLTLETGNTTLDETFQDKHTGCLPGEYVVLAVSDTGFGMDEETLEHVFEPFFTTKEEGKGTGLGLSTVYGIAKQNKGFVNIYSEQGKGTTVKVYFPRYTGDDEAEPVESGEVALKGGEETILLVEDEDQVRKLARTILERLGYRVLEAAAPGEAITMAEKHRNEIHLLLTDLVMPVMHGRELYERISALKPGIKVLYMSGYAPDAVVHGGVLEKGTPFLPKPFTLDELGRKVRKVLDQVDSET
ncbi:MAG: response regulator [Deltaproteobacteria bacterium]|nr:response regulator [Deltaproteobacteria bacterium]